MTPYPTTIGTAFLGKTPAGRRFNGRGAFAKLRRFATAANMTGLPANSFPVDYTQNGLPIGLQIMGKAWDEENLLRMAFNAEQVVERKAPEVYYKLPD